MDELKRQAYLSCLQDTLVEVDTEIKEYRNKEFTDKIEELQKLKRSILNILIEFNR